MPAVELRAIVTDADRRAVMGLRRAPGQERFLPDMDDHFEEATRFPQACPRMFAVHDGVGDRLLGFAMISDGIPGETLDADPELIGPFYLWRLLIDQKFQEAGYGRATIEAVAEYVRARGGRVLWTSCAGGEGSPQPFYLHLGFVKSGRVVGGEDVLGLDLGQR